MTGAAYITFREADADAGRDVMHELVRQGLACSARAPDPLQSILDSRSLIALLGPGAESDDVFRRDLALAMANGRPVVPVPLQDPGDALRALVDLQSRIDARAGLSAAVLSRIADSVRAFGGPGRAIAMLNIKGGVGKTVLAANLFAAAHMERNTSVCFIDLDPQHNLSQFFLPPEERNRVRADAHTIYSVFLSRGPLSAPREEFQRLPLQLNRTKGLGKRRFDIVVGDERLFEFTMDGRSERERLDALSRFHDLVGMLRARYDVVVIDANPCATFLTRCAVSAADHVVAPVRPEKYSLTGLNMLEQVARTIRSRPARAEEFSVLLNGVGERARGRAGASVDDATREEILSAPFFGASLIEDAIPYSAGLRSSPVDRYAANPINLTAMRFVAQRPLKEALVRAADRILQRAAP